MQLFFDLLPILPPIIVLGIALWVVHNEKQESYRLWRENERLTQAYRELTEQSSEREHALLDEIIAERNSANLMAPIVEELVKTLESTAELLKDSNPPSLENEKYALKIYHERKANRKDVG